MTVREPYHYRKNTVFLEGIYLNQGGIWLAHELQADQEPPQDKPLIYHSHNCDNLINQLGLLHPYDLWTEYAKIATEQELTYPIDII